MKKYFLQILVFIFCAKMSAQNFTQFTSSSVARENAIASNYVIGSALDAKGNIWFATRGGGISMFNGTSWKTLTTKNGLPSDFLTSITIDKKGVFWMGCDIGLIKYDGNSWALINDLSGIKIKAVSQLGIDSTDHLWLGVTDGVVEYDKISFKKFSKNEGLLDNSSPRSIYVDSKNVKWFVYSNGANVYDDITMNKYDSTTGLPSGLSGITSVVESKNGEIIIGGNKIYSLNKTDNKFTLIPNPTGINSIATRSLKFDMTDNLWVSANGGIYKLNSQGEWKIFKEGIADFFNRQITVDNKNNIYVGSFTGITLIKNDVVSILGVDEGIGSNFISKSFKDSKNNLWFGGSSGLVRYKDGKWKTFTTKHGLPDNSILAIDEDKEGNILMSIGGELVKIKDDNITIMNGAGNEIFDGLIDIKVAKNGIIYISTVYGFYYFDGTNWNKIDNIEYMNSIKIEDNSTIWTYDSNKLYKIQNFKKVDSFLVADLNIQNAEFYNFFITSNKEYYLQVLIIDFSSTATYYTYKIENNKLVLEDKLANVGLIEDHENEGNDSWFASSEGLEKYNGTALEVFELKNKNINPVNSYSIEIDQNGGKWLGSDFGIFYFPKTVSTLDQLQNAIAFTISPNPSSDKINCNLNFTNENNVTIYNSLGMECYKGSINNNSLDVSSLGHGLYSVIVNDNKKMYISKFVKI